MKTATLFVQVIKEDGSSFWYGWKSYSTIENAIQAFEHLGFSNYMDWKIGDTAKIVCNSAVTFYKRRGK